jgi:hypothetical protein
MSRVATVACVGIVVQARHHRAGRSRCWGRVGGHGGRGCVGRACRGGGPTDAGLPNAPHRRDRKAGTSVDTSGFECPGGVDCTRQTTFGGLAAGPIERGRSPRSGPVSTSRLLCGALFGAHCSTARGATRSVAPRETAPMSSGQLRRECAGDEGNESVACRAQPRGVIRSAEPCPYRCPVAKQNGVEAVLAIRWRGRRVLCPSLRRAIRSAALRGCRHLVRSKAAR